MITQNAIDHTSRLISHIWDIFYHEIWQRIIVYGIILWAMYAGILGIITH